MDIEEKDNCHLSAEASMQQESTAGTAIDWNWTSASAADAYTPPVTTQGVANAVGLVVHGALKQVHEHTDKTIAETLTGIGVAGVGYLATTVVGIGSTTVAAAAALPAMAYATFKEAQSTYKAGVELYRTGHVTTPDYFDSLAEKAKNSIVQNASAFDIVSRNNNQGNELPTAKAQLESLGAQSIQVGAGLIGGSSGDLSIQAGRFALKSTFDTAMWLGKTTLTDSFGPQSEYALATGAISKEVTTNLAKGSPSLLAPSAASADMPIMLSQNQGGDGSQLSGEPLTDTQIRELLKDETRLARLTPRQQEVLRLYLEQLPDGRQRTFKEIGQALDDVSRQRAEQLVKGVLLKLSSTESRAARKIKQMSEAMQDQARMAALTPRRQEVLRLRYELLPDGRQRTTQEIAHELGLSPAAIFEHERWALLKLSSTESRAAGKIEKMPEAMQDKARMAALTAQEQQVLQLRFEQLPDGRQRTFKEIGQALDVSEMHAGRILREALHDLRFPESTKTTRINKVIEAMQDQARMAALTPRQQEVLRLRYELFPDGRQRTLKDVGDKLGVSFTAVRDSEQLALKKLLKP